MRLWPLRNSRRYRQPPWKGTRYVRDDHGGSCESKGRRCRKRDTKRQRWSRRPYVLRFEIERQLVKEKRIDYLP